MVEINTEYQNIIGWFNGYYAEHEQKYRRLIALNKLDDDGGAPQSKLVSLYKEAEIKRKRLQEIQQIFIMW